MDKKELKIYLRKLIEHIIKENEKETNDENK